MVILIERHRHFVTGIASRFLLSQEDTREVVQDTFIRIWKHTGDYDNRSRFTTWLYTITFNICLDRIKAIKRRRELFCPANEGQLADLLAAYGDQARDLDREIIAGAVRNIAGGMAETQRIVFVLRDIHDMTVEEVCRITGFDTTKVKTNLYHARKYMREKLLEGGYL